MSLPNPLPNGSYQQTCQQCTVTTTYYGLSVLNCNCKKLDNSLQNTSLVYPTVTKPLLDVANINGNLENVNPYQQLCQRVCYQPCQPCRPSYCRQNYY